MESWKPEPTVKVTLHLTEEAARILRQYAGERNRGRFVSHLLLAQRERDEAEAQFLGHAAGGGHARGSRPKKRRR